ncbi:MAG TPA: hypothetical protein VFG09_10885 [Thermodesulfovibrionales bacterium]|nr:hypothetical protein [Thermodesulfovibrionales bacterium]
MKSKGRIFLLGMLMVIVGCMATRFSDVWVDETYQKGPINDILVMAIFPSPERAIMVEDEMARQLRSRGVNTVQSYVEFPGKRPSEDEVMSLLDRRKMDAVLIAKFIKREYKSTGNPNDPYSAAGAQPYAVIETSLYDVKTQKKIWSALSETWIVGMDSRLNSSFVSNVLKKLADDKFIR